MNCSISNSKNYLGELKTTNQEIIKKYSILVNEYLELFQTNVKFSNSHYLNNILTKGFTALNHIFNLILLYTKNINLAFTYCQKSIFYYIEFIEQISEDANSFLQLNSQDAVLFMYKKTIYDIDNEHRKNFVLTNEKDKQKLYVIKEITIIIEKIIGYYLDNDIKISEIDFYLNKIIKRIMTNKLSHNHLLSIHSILNNLILVNISILKFNYFISYIFKHPTFNERDVLFKINSDEFKDKKNTLSHFKFTLWLIEKS
tara:strand:+ start:162 stop:932 length:771 start_codon:yes stop_codon:yes gene_type:complete